jgi:hypothetical protein
MQKILPLHFIALITLFLISESYGCVCNIHRKIILKLFITAITSNLHDRYDNAVPYNLLVSNYNSVLL